MTKKCIKCGESKEFEKFHKHKTGKMGLDSSCKACKKIYYLNNIERHKKVGAIWRAKPESKKIEYKRLRKRYLDNKESIDAYKKEWNKKNIDKNRKYIREWTSNKRKTDINYQIAYQVRSRIADALRNNKKHKKSEELLGCSFEEYKIYLRYRFLSGMSWENRKKWNIDHIIPCCAFNLIHESEQKQCFHFSNTQPLWKTDNLRKISQDLEVAKKRLPFVKFNVGVTHEF